MTDQPSAAPQQGRALQQSPVSPSLALTILAGGVQQDIARILAEHGMNPRKHGALGHIHREPGISISELARRSGITAQSMHTLIASLIADDLVQSTIPRPGAPASLAVTDAGTHLLAAIRAELAVLDERLFGPAAPAEWQALARAVHAVAELRKRT
ncbi:DNA-binding MarR family transcriptional regulator [Arthrobacter woluwensis]|uniref:MarR family winged helix-turn-helix transcriptional regulator n=1 Tax=Arthrobacter woluwensis TaxID=156980 RepID=UPI0027857EE4|nr:MarR family transcriptional regulator [Arthrobacter woluwensis]MDQ0710091.1 DNA-binding MarR family transcriptional regulator [Arthrobacter woluwensis]